MTMLEDIESAYFSTLWDLKKLEWCDGELPDVYNARKRIDFAVGRLREGLEEPEGEDVRALATRAYRVVVECARELESVDGADRDTRNRLWNTRDALRRLLDAIEPLVSGAERACRGDLLRDEY
jgi:hypothetical protein